MRVIEDISDQCSVGHPTGRDESKGSVFGGFHRHDEAKQASSCGTELMPWMADHPPCSTEKLVAVAVAVAVAVSLALGAIQQVLMGRRKPCSDSVGFDTEGVDRPLASRCPNEVASIEVRSNVSRKACCLAQSQ